MMMIVRLGLILMLIAGVAAGGLSLLNNTTAPIIAENKALEQKEAREEVARSAGAAEFDKIVLEDGFEYYVAKNKEGDDVGYVCLAEGKGYSSTIETVAGFDLNYEILGLKITFQQETPGLGTKAEEVKKGENEPWFLRSFKGKNGLDVAVVKDRGEVDAITGATITSRAISNSINDVSRKIQAHVLSKNSAENNTIEENGGEGSQQ